MSGGRIGAIIMIMKKILHTINQVKQEQVRNLGQYDLHQLTGQVTPDVTFTGEFRENHDQATNDGVCVNLNYKGRELGQLYTPDASATDAQVWVTAPDCSARESVLTITQDAEQKVAVLHQPDQDADALVNKIHRVVALSQAKNEIAQKLKTLNLPPLKLLDAMDDVIDKVYQAPDRQV